MKLLYIPLWIFLIVLFAALSVMNLARYQDYQQELASLVDALAAEERITAELKAQTEYYASDAYIEQLARDILGYVKQDEIVFVNIAE